MAVAERPRRGPRGQGDTRPRRGEPTTVIVQPSAVTVTFPVASGTWLKSTQAAWTTLIGSPLASAYLDTDVAALWWLHELMDERARALAAYRAKRTVKGHAGQERVNGAATLALQFGVEIGQLQRAYGLNPGARAKLGMVFAQAQTSLEDMRKAAEAQAATSRDPRVRSKA
jgi:hypothetical protein